MHGFFALAPSAPASPAVQQVPPPPSDGSVLRPVMLVLAVIVILAGRELMKKTDWYWSAVEWSDRQRARHERAEWERQERDRRDRAEKAGEDYEEEEYEGRETFSRARGSTLPSERRPFTWWGLREVRDADPSDEQGKRRSGRGQGRGSWTLDELGLAPDVEAGEPAPGPAREEPEPAPEPPATPAPDPLPPLDVVIGNLLDRGADRDHVIRQCRTLGYPDARVQQWLFIIEHERGATDDEEDLDTYLVRRWHDEVMAETLGRRALRREASERYGVSDSTVKRAISTLKASGRIPEDSPGIDAAA